MDSSSVTSSVGVNQQGSPQQESEAHPDEAGAAKLTAVLSSKQRVVLELLLHPNVSVPEAAKQAGVHRGTVNRWLLEDANFIAAFNARKLEMAMLSEARLLSLVPKAIEAIEAALEDGNAYIAMQLLRSGLLTAAKGLSLSAGTIADQHKVAERQQEVALQKQQVELQLQEEAAIVAGKAAEEAREDRLEKELPHLERYERERRSIYEMLAYSKHRNAKLQEIDARVKAAVAKAASAMTNPGVEQPPKQASPDAGQASQDKATSPSSDGADAT